MRYERLNSKGCDCSFADYDFLEDNSISFRHCCKKLPNTKLGCGTGKIVLSYPDQSVIEGKMNISYGSMRKFKWEFCIKVNSQTPKIQQATSQIIGSFQPTTTITPSFTTARISTIPSHKSTLGCSLGKQKLIKWTQRQNQLQTLSSMLILIAVKCTNQIKVLNAATQDSNEWKQKVVVFVFLQSLFNENKIKWF